METMKNVNTEILKDSSNGIYSKLENRFYYYRLVKVKFTRKSIGEEQKIITTVTFDGKDIGIKRDKVTIDVADLDVKSHNLMFHEKTTQISVDMMLEGNVQLTDEITDGVFINNKVILYIDTKQPNDYVLSCTINLAKLDESKLSQKTKEETDHE